MKRLSLLLILFVCGNVFCQTFNDIEYFTVSASIDPSASYKEQGIDIVAEIEYVGVIYAKLGVESFSTLQGNYRDVHGAIGLNKVFGMFNTERIYLGGRMAKVNRGSEGAFRINYGLEGGYQHTFNEHFLLGLRATLDKRHDQEIYGWHPETMFSGFITIGYRWDYNPNRYRR